MRAPPGMVQRCAFYYSMGSLPFCPQTAHYEFARIVLKYAQEWDRDLSDYPSTNASEVRVDRLRSASEEPRETHLRSIRRILSRHLAKRTFHHEVRWSSAPGAHSSNSRRFHGRTHRSFSP